MVHRTPEGNLHQQLDDSPPTQKSNKINFRRGVPQGDTISPKLFTPSLGNIFRRLTWETRGLKIDGEYLSHLRLTDDILICANTPHELQQMLHELADESENQGLNMKKSNTKVMMENDTPIYVDADSRCGSSMLRPSPNHGTLWLHNEDDECYKHIYMPTCRFFPHFMPDNRLKHTL